MSPKPWPHLKKIKKTKQNKTKIKTKNQFYVKPISHAIGHPSIVYTANTHTQLLVLENHKYPPSQIFG